MHLAQDAEYDNVLVFWRTWADGEEFVALHGGNGSGVRRLPVAPRIATPQKETPQPVNMTIVGGRVYGQYHSMTYSQSMQSVSQVGGCGKVQEGHLDIHRLCPPYRARQGPPTGEIVLWFEKLLCTSAIFRPL
jgi:hypothetical protein